MKLNDCLDFISYGFTNPMSDSDVGPWKLTAKDIIDGKINYNTARHTTTEEYLKLTNKSRPKIGDVLLTKDGTLGRVAVVDRDNVCINQSVAVLRPNKLVISEYLKYLLMTDYYQELMLGDANGSTIKHLYITKVAEMDISLPDKETQKEIVNVLGNIDGQIERNNAMVQKLQDMVLTRYSIMFQNKKSKNALLKDICLLPSGYNFKPESYNDYGKYKLITIKNVCDTFVDDANTDKLSEVPNIKDYCYLSVGDILLSLTGNVGRISIVHSKDNLLNQRVSLLQAKENYKIYSYCLLKSQEYQFIMTNIARGTSQKNLSPIDVENLKVYAPTFEEIKAFNENTENYFNEMLIIKQSTDKLITLKEKLLPLLINGQLNI